MGLDEAFACAHNHGLTRRTATDLSRMQTLAVATVVAAAAATAEEGVMVPVVPGNGGWNGGWIATTEAGVAATGVAAIATLITTGAATEAEDTGAVMEEEEGTEVGLRREGVTTTGVTAAAAVGALQCLLLQ